MKHYLLLILIILAAFVPAIAQNTYNCEISLLEDNEKAALFSVQVEVDKKVNTEKNASEALLTTLLTQGVTGFHNGLPLSKKEIKYWKNENNLFKSEDNYLKYINYQLESEPVATTSGKLKGKVYVRLNKETFFRYLERYGVLSK